MKKSKLKILLLKGDDRIDVLTRHIEHLRKEKEELNRELTKWMCNAIEMQNKHANYIKTVCESLGVTKNKVIDAFDADLPGQVKEPYFDNPVHDEPVYETPKMMEPEPESAGTASPRGIISDWRIWANK